MRPILLLVLVMTGSCGPRPAATSALHGDSGVVVPYSSDEIAHRTVRAIPSRWRAFATEIVYGRSERGLDLRAVRIADPGATPEPGTARPAVLLAQAIHGNEYLDVANHVPAALFGVDPVLLAQAGADLSAFDGLPTVPLAGMTRFLAAGGVFYVIPVENPDGFTARQRANAEGLDLNRDFPIAHYVDDPDIPAVSESAENLALAAFTRSAFEPKAPADWSVPDAAAQVRPWTKLVGAREDLKIFFDYHCCQDPRTGALMYPWGETPSLEDPLGLPAADVDAYRFWGEMYKDVFPEDFFGSGIQAIGYIAKGTGDEHVYEHFADVALTYEGRSGGIEPQRLARHAQFWDLALTELVTKGLKTKNLTRVETAP